MEKPTSSRTRKSVVLFGTVGGLAIGRTICLAIHMTIRLAIGFAISVAVGGIFAVIVDPVQIGDGQILEQLEKLVSTMEVIVNCTPISHISW